jgi:hypothetical protein
MTARTSLKFGMSEEIERRQLKSGYLSCLPKLLHRSRTTLLSVACPAAPDGSV